jgi:hypothetical protein
LCTKKEEYWFWKAYQFNDITSHNNTCMYQPTS